MRVVYLIVEYARHILDVAPYRNIISCNLLTYNISLFNVISPVCLINSIFCFTESNYFTALRSFYNYLFTKFFFCHI
jgi:hypothetical protein